MPQSYYIDRLDYNRYYAKANIATAAYLNYLRLTKKEYYDIAK